MKRRVMWYFLLLVALIVSVAFVVPWVKMSKMLDGHWSNEPYSASEFGVTSEPLSLRSADGVELSAYQVKVDNPQAVVICLGGIHSGTITNWYGHARLFADNGYASLLLDVRAHGGSGGERIYAATREWQDVAAAVEYIRSESYYREVPIVVMGLSMGAATAVVSAGRIEEIDALISLSAYSSWDYNFNLHAEQTVPKVVAAVLRPFVTIVSKIRFGKYYAITPKNEIAKLGNRSALIVQAVGDTMVYYGNFERLIAAAPPTVERWVVDCDNHCIIDDFVHPQSSAEYCNRIIDFLDRNFKR